MEDAAPRREAGDVPRLVILWTRPYHLSREQADAWVSSEVAGLAATPGVDGARVVKVQRAALEHPSQWDWMLELDVGDAATVTGLLRRGDVADWLRDLRLLGMRPTVMLIANDAVSGAAT